MPNIIIKNYEHFNTAMPNWNTPKGVYVKNKDHYDRLMKENGMVSYEEMKNKTESNKNRRNEYKPSTKALGIMKEAIKNADKHGNVKLSGRAIDGLKEMKAIKPKIPNYMQIPRQYQPKGGFNG